MTEQQRKQRIAELEMEIASLRGNWLPGSLGDTYYFADGLGKAIEYKFSASDFDFSMHRAFNMFPTKEQAQKEADWMVKRRVIEWMGKQGAPDGLYVLEGISVVEVKEWQEGAFTFQSREWAERALEKIITGQ